MANYHITIPSIGVVDCVTPEAAARVLCSWFDRGGFRPIVIVQQVDDRTELPIGKSVTIDTGQLG